MSTISSCPQCAKQVTVPSDVGASEYVRCPLCHSEYTLGEALAGAPPMLILVGSLSLVGGAGSSDRSMHGEAVHEEAVHNEGPRLADTDLHLFSRGMAELPAAPSIDLTSTPNFAEDDEHDLELDLAEGANHFDEPGNEPGTVQIDHSAASVEIDDASGPGTPEQDTEIDPLNFAAGTEAPLEEEPVDFDSPSVPFEMADDEQVEIDTAQLGAFGEDDFEEDAFGEDSVLGVHAMKHPTESDAAAEESFGFTESSEGAEIGLPGGVPKVDAGASPTLTTSPRRQRRKPSLLALLIIWGTSLPVAAIMAYAILLWVWHTDPIGLAPTLPSFLVPASMAGPAGRTAAPLSAPGGNQMAQTTKPNDEELPGFESNVPKIEPKSVAGGAAHSAGDETDADMPADDAAADTEPADGDETTPAAKTADSGSADDEMAAEEDDDAPVVATKPVKPSGGKVKPPADDEDADSEPADTGTPAADADEETAMDEPAKPAADEMAADESETSDADAADSTPADVPGSDLTAPEETETPAVVVGPRDNVRYALDEVDKALTGVRDAAKAMAKADKDELKKLKSLYYRKLYALAEVATFADNQEADPRAAKQQADVHKVLAAAAADPNRFSEIGKAAGKWMSLAKGKEHQGIVLSGSVQGIRKQGEVFETKILLTDGAQSITVLSPLKLPFAKDEQVVVLGSIVSDPATSVEGYQGVEPAAVWSGLVLNVADAGAAR
jgi:hypothetical protein